MAGLAWSLLAASLATASAQEPPARWRPDGDRLLVLIDGDPSARGSDRSLAGWLSFSIASGLEQREAARVVAFRSVQRFLQARVVPEGALSQEHIAELAALTHARIAIIGELALQTDHLRLTLRILDLRTGPIAEPFTLATTARRPPHEWIDTAVDHLLARLTGSPTPERVRASSVERPPPSPASYRLFEAGLRAAAEGHSADALRDLDQAFALDSTFVSARLEALYLRWIGYDLTAVDSLIAELDRRGAALLPRERIEVELARAQSADDVEAGLAAARRYVAYVPEDPYPLGLFALRGNYLEEALLAFRSVSEASPLTARSRDHWSQYVRTLHMLGRYDDERDAAARAAVLFPDSRVTAWYQVRALIGQRRVGEALRLHRHIEAMPDPSSNAGIGQWGNTVRELLAHGARDSADVVLARIIATLEAVPPDRRAAVRPALAAHYQLAGRWSEAEAIALSLLDETPDDAVWQRKNHYTALGCIAAARGDERLARTWLHRLDSLRAATPHRPGVAMRAALDVAQGTVLACLGDRERAVALLERGIRTPGAPGYGFGYGFGPWLHRNLFYEKLRGFEPFERLVRPRE